MNVEDMKKEQTMRENKKVMLKKLNDKGITSVIEKEHRGRFSSEGGWDCNTHVFRSL
jgi:hypothetical protein